MCEWGKPALCQNQTEYPQNKVEIELSSGYYKYKLFRAQMKGLCLKSAWNESPLHFCTMSGRLVCKFLPVECFEHLAASF